MASLMAAAAVRPRVREVGVFSTTATGFNVALRRITVAGATHAAETEIYEDDSSATATATVVNVDTGTAPTLAAGYVRIATLASAIGAGIIWTFGGNGLIIPDGTANGLAVIGLNTPQICTVYFVWDE